MCSATRQKESLVFASCSFTLRGRQGAGGSSSWPSRLREKAAPPTKDYMLVFVGEGEDQPRAAAAIASTKGFERTAILEGGVEAFNSSVLAQVWLLDKPDPLWHDSVHLSLTSETAYREQSNCKSSVQPMRFSKN